MARSIDDVVLLSASAASLTELEARQSVCRACPRLVAWREKVAVDRRAAFADQPYWGRPAPGWGDPEPSILVVGLAPAAHGANRTGRVFTGDRSGDWLFAAMHRAGLSSQPTSVASDDGLELHGARVVAAVRCAPPANKPTPAERDTCAPWLDAELKVIRPSLRVVVALGGFAWSVILSALARAGADLLSPRPRFGHGARVEIQVEGAEVGPGRSSVSLVLIGCFHPSQQNTFTGRLTESMLDDVFTRAVRLANR